MKNLDPLLHPAHLLTLGMSLLGASPVLLAQTATDAQAPSPVSAIPTLHSAEPSGHLTPVLVSEKLGQYRQFDKVEITGSSIVRKEQNTTLPVELITRNDIRRSGHTRLVDVVQRLPLMSNFAEPGQLATNRGGASSAAIHGMPTGTLVLLNGKRLSTFGLQNSAGAERPKFDLNWIPLAAVDRIEVLSDGASSLYGTDAIAGVINIITRTDRRGVEISTDKVIPDGNKGGGTTASLSWGKGSLRRDGYTLQITGEVADRDRLKGADRPYLSTGRQSFMHEGRSYYADGVSLGTSGAFYTSPATLYSPADAATGQPEKAWNSVYQDGQCPDGWIQKAGQSACIRNPYPSFDIYPSLQSRRLHALGEMALPAGRALYAELNYSEQTERIENTVWSFRQVKIGPDSSYPGYDLAVANGFDPAKTLVRWRPYDVPARHLQYKQRNWRLAGGSHGVLGDWDYHANAYHSRSEADFGLLLSTIPNDFGVDSQGRLTMAQWLEPLQPGSAFAQSLSSFLNFSPRRHGVTDLTAAELRGSRTVFEHDGRETKLGVGTEWRREQMKYREPNRTASTPTQPDFEGSRYLMAGYAELQWPVLDDWELTGALRHDRYSDVGGTTNAKVSTKWQVLPSFSLRGSAGTGFRAPTIGQLQDTPTPYSFGTSSETNTCSAELTDIAKSLRHTDGKPGTCTPGSIAAYTTNSPDLKPENSRQISAGFRVSPTGNLTVSADYWRVSMHNTLREVSDVAVMNNPAAHRANFILDQTGKLVLYLPVQNLGSSLKEGIDFDARLRMPTELGRLIAGVNGTWMLTSRAENNRTSDLGRFSSDSATVTPRLKARSWLGLAQSGWSITLMLNYTSGFNDATVKAVNAATNQTETITDRRVPSFVTWDLTGGHELNKNLELRAGVYNLTNRRAPLSFAQTAGSLWGANTVQANALGRIVFLHGILRF